MSVVLALHHFYLQTLVLQGVSFTRENIYVPVATVDATFSKITEQHFKAIYAHCFILFDLYVFLSFEQQMSRYLCL